MSASESNSTATSRSSGRRSSGGGEGSGSGSRSESGGGQRRRRRRRRRGGGGGGGNSSGGGGGGGSGGGNSSGGGGGGGGGGRQSDGGSSSKSSSNRGSGGGGRGSSNRKNGSGGRGRRRSRRRGSENRQGGGRENQSRQSQDHAATQVVVEPQETAGVLELEGKGGSGYLRLIKNDLSTRDDDIFVPQNLIREHHLQTGVFIEGMEGTPPKNNARRGRRPAPRRALLEIKSIDGYPPDAPEIVRRRDFKVLTSIDPEEKFQLSRATKDPSMRLVDLLTPVGMGQRGLIVAPPRTGKTMLLQGLAHQITQNHPDAHLIVVLVDERPEEATDWKRKVEHGEVMSSTSDEMASNHVNIAELAIERAKRLVEVGQDVVILFDSLTRLARAYNIETKNSGRTLTGGVDARTLEKPKAFFGAARNVEEGGSLTILATALIETGSRMDEVIFEEFKGTGNMELVLSRKLADMRIFPAIDMHLSGTRKEEKLIPPEQLKSVWALRRVLQKIDPVEGMRILINKLDESGTNEDFLASFQQA